MKAWIQRVARASVTIDGECVSRIDRGYLVLLGVTQTDTDAEADRIAAGEAPYATMEEGFGELD